MLGRFKCVTNPQNTILVEKIYRYVLGAGEKLNIDWVALWFY
ncbi:hypothetical protein S3E15_02726 [Bacillus mycoides]|uniref:Uncharacterized protein n=1 Tax=Bacillus mycoides TaxID=1405 RepID=A0AAP7W4N2_BACMY|nr:hypothetical protein S3E15_02726 [Bacillus mycoides]